MSEYIEREQCIRTVCEACNMQYGDEPCEPSDCFMRERLMEMPAAEVEPVVHARWVWDIGDVYGCSCCGEKSHVKEVMEVPDWGWCPNCGARMDGGDHHERN